MMTGTWIKSKSNRLLVVSVGFLILMAFLLSLRWLVIDYGSSKTEVTQNVDDGMSLINRLKSWDTGRIDIVEEKFSYSVLGYQSGTLHCFMYLLDDDAVLIAVEDFTITLPNSSEITDCKTFVKYILKSKK